MVDYSMSPPYYIYSSHHHFLGHSFFWWNYKGWRKTLSISQVACWLFFSSKSKTYSYSKPWQHFWKSCKCTFEEQQYHNTPMVQLKLTRLSPNMNSREHMFRGKPCQFQLPRGTLVVAVFVQKSMLLQAHLYFIPKFWFWLNILNSIMPYSKSCLKSSANLAVWF